MYVRLATPWSRYPILVAASVNPTLETDSATESDSGDGNLLPSENMQSSVQRAFGDHVYS